ncbi:MAG: septum formation inhibitor [Bacteroidales bacterium]|jgi:cell division protein FtsB|nr:septum formation inhibitor [Bacteroidales bacterium]
MTTYGKIKNIISVALKHKIWCAIIIFVVWVAFFDQYSWLLQWKIKQSINALTVEKQYYVNKIQNDSTMYSELQTNDNNLEKFAREQYFMKAADEDVFEIVEQ